MNLQIHHKKIYIAIYTTLCVDMSVSVCPDPSLWEEIGFIILQHKCSEIIWNGKYFSDYCSLNIRINKNPHNQRIGRGDMIDADIIIYTKGYVRRLVFQLFLYHLLMYKFDKQNENPRYANELVGRYKLLGLLTIMTINVTKLNI